MALATNILGLRETWNPHSKWGLAALVLHFTDCPVDKSERLTDWEASPLTEKQITYAALDVFYVCHAHLILHDLSHHWNSKRATKAFIWFYGDEEDEDESDDEPESDHNSDNGEEEEEQRVHLKQRQRIGGRIDWHIDNDDNRVVSGLILSRSDKKTDLTFVVEILENGNFREVGDNLDDDYYTAPGFRDNEGYWFTPGHKYGKVSISGKGWSRIHLFKTYPWCTPQRSHTLSPQWVKSNELEAGPYLGTSAISATPVDMMAQQSTPEVLSLCNANIVRAVCVIHSERHLAKLRGYFVKWTQQKQDLMRGDI
eukprot:1621044-Prymnesium_polylepis.1